jgi:hypothetical protein
MEKKLRFSRLNHTVPLPREEGPLTPSPEPPKKTLRQALLECIINVFSSGRKKENAILIARETCNTAIETLSEKEKILQSKIDEAEAKCGVAMKDKNADGAVQHLKRKKYFLRQLEKIRAHKFNIEAQVESLDETSTNHGVLIAMKKVTKALKRTGKEFNINAADTVVDDLQDIMDETGEVSANLQHQDYLHQGLPTDEDLHAELFGPVSRPIALRALRAPPVPPVPPAPETRSVRVPPMPLVPSHKVTPLSMGVSV